MPKLRTCSLHHQSCCSRPNRDTAILYRAEMVRYRNTNGSMETTAPKRPFLPFSFAPLPRLFPYIYAFPHPSTPLYNFRSPLENKLFCRTHNPHWFIYSSVPGLPFPTICQEENTWCHIPEERSFGFNTIPPFIL